MNFSSVGPRIHHDNSPLILRLHSLGLTQTSADQEVDLELPYLILADWFPTREKIYILY